MTPRSCCSASRDPSCSRSGRWGGGKLNATTILLEPLGEGDASELVDNLLGRADIASVARNRILEAAEGNPLFVEEMLGMLIDDGLLRFDGDTWRGVDDLEQVTVPPTIQLLAARLDRLDADERAVMERGSVEGKIFHAGAVATLSPATLRPNVRPRLLALARKELIRPDRAEFVGEDAFRFRHLLIRDAAYQAMPKEQRADLHERYAGWLERAAGDRLPEYEEILAPPRAGPPLPGRARATRRANALDRPGRGRATALLRRAGPGTGRLRIRPVVAHPMRRARSARLRAHGARGGAERARRLPGIHERSDRRRERGPRGRRGTGRPPCARSDRRDRTSTRRIRPPARERTWSRSCDASRRSATRTECSERLAVGRLDFYDGNCTKSIAVSLRLFEPARGRPYRDRAALAEGLGSGAFFGPIQVGEAFELIDRALGLLPDSIVNEAALGSVRAALLAMQDRPGEARSEMARARDLWAELGHPSAMTGTSLATGIMEQLLGRPDLAEQGYREGGVPRSPGGDRLQLHDAGRSGERALRTGKVRRGRRDRAPERRADRRRRLRLRGGGARRKHWSIRAAASTMRRSSSRTPHSATLSRPTTSR